MENQKNTFHIIVVLIALFSLYIILKGGYFSETNTKAILVQQMHTKLGEQATIDIVASTEVKNYNLIGFTYTTTNTDGIACGIFSLDDSGKPHLFRIITKDDFHRYTMDIYDIIIDLPTNSGSLYSYRIILSERKNLKKILVTDSSGQCETHLIENTPAFIVIDIHSQREFVDDKGNPIPIV